MVRSSAVIGRRSQNVARNLRALRKAKGWSIARLAEACAERSDQAATWYSLSNIERGALLGEGTRKPRLVSVDDLFLLAEVLGVSVEALAGQPACDSCRDVPPEGFTCNTCGARDAKNDV